MAENCVYRFLNKDNEIIYIGKAKDLNSRLSSHVHLPKECYKEVNAVEYCIFETEYEMDLAERYYIPKIKPKYNKMLSGNELNISILEFDNKKWSIYKNPKKKVKKKVTKKKNTLNKNIVNFEKHLKEIELEKKREYNKKINKKIIVPFTEEVFENMFVASEMFNLDIEEVYNLTENIEFYGYKHPKYNCNLHFMYYEDFLKHREEDINYLKYTIQKYTRGIVCLTTNEFFVNSIEVEEKYNVVCNKVIDCCRGLSNYVGVVDDKPMVYKWRDSYEKMTTEDIDDLMNKAIRTKVRRKY